MALESRLELKLSQKLVLTPQLQMAIKLLQMPQLELSQALSQELVENPFLEETMDTDFDTQGQTAKEERGAEPEEETVREHDDTEIPLEKMMSFSAEDYFE
jgi:RNA polymerase sigma-54 factor